MPVFRRDASLRRPLAKLVPYHGVTVCTSQIANRRHRQIRKMWLISRACTALRDAHVNHAYLSSPGCIVSPLTLSVI